MDIIKPDTSTVQCTMPFTSNHLRGMLSDNLNAGKPEADSRALVITYIKSQTWATGYILMAQSQTAISVPFPESYAQMVLRCAQPDSTIAASVLAGSWLGLQANAPGFCVSCATVLLQQQQRQGIQFRVCNRTIPEEKAKDCCAGCMLNFMPIVSASSGVGFVCVQTCKPGYVFSQSTGKCQACPPGLFSAGGNQPCVPCASLVGDPNSWPDPKHGCQVCGSRAMVGSSGTACKPCSTGQYVPAGHSACRYCEQTGYYLPERGPAVCVPCPLGTYIVSSGSSVTCTLCPKNTFTSVGGASQCTPCPAGSVSNSNYSGCVPCPAINTGLLLAQYFQQGCSLQCIPGVSYLRTSPYVPGGCANCSSITVPIGAYADVADCSVAHPCKNAVANSHYTGPSTARGNAMQCPWACNAGYVYAYDSDSKAACKACVVPGFSPSKHMFTTGCFYTCLPRIFVDLPALTCAVACRDVLADYRAGLIGRRVRDYAVLLQRPLYVQGVCGTNESVPRSDLPFLRKGRWAYYISPDALAASPPPSYTKSACGNSMLDVGETCDDGNTVSGDGCSGTTCRVETNAYWDCDLIGQPCLPNCSWSVNAPQAGGLGLLGYVLPPCAASCSCQNLSYYDIVSLPPKARAAWMSQHLIPCDCGGIASRTLPYAQCTAQNRGCVSCPSGYYFDDLLAKCALCGSVCMPGYTAAVGSLLACSSLGWSGSSSSSTTTASNTTKEGQAAVGCVPCPDIGPVRYVAGCNYMCYMDTTGESTAQNTYCSKPPSSVDGSCPGACLSCSTKLSALVVTVASSSSKGFYPAGCYDVVGYSWLPCDPQSKPNGAVWTSNSFIAGTHASAFFSNLINNN